MRRSSRRGANALEFALCLPVFLAVVFATIDFGWVYWNKTSLTSAVAIACRAGSTRDPGVGEANLTGVVSFTQAKVQSELARDALPCGACTVTIDAVGANPERSLRCKVERPVRSLTGLTPGLTGASSLSAFSVARFEYQR